MEHPAFGPQLEKSEMGNLKAAREIFRGARKLTLNIVIVQPDIFRGDPEKNRSAYLKMFKGQKIKSDSLIVFPELATTGFITEASDLKNPVLLSSYKEDLKFYSQLAQKFQSYVMGSSLLMRNSKFENWCFLYGPQGKKLGGYQKLHSFRLGGEAKQYRSGEKVFRKKIGEFKTQISICYDLRFPELYVAGFKKGVQLFVVSANWPEKRAHHWETLLRARAIENQAYVVGVNRVGKLGGISYKGGSQIISPTGRVLVHASDALGVFAGEININQCIHWRERFSVIKDKKPVDFYFK